MTKQDRSTQFHDLTSYVAIRRLAGLAVSPDGDRLVTSVAELSADRKKYVTALWEIDPTGERPAQRLTRSAPGESQPAFLPDGSLLFTSRRPDPQAEENEETAGLWLLPAGAGEARQIADRPGGVGAVAIAEDTGTVAFSSQVLPSAQTSDEDEAARKARKDAGVTAILHERYPVRYWDHDLGPAQSRVLVAGPLDGRDRLDEPRDLTPRPEGRVNLDLGLAISPDGSTVALVWEVDDLPSRPLPTIVLADTASGEHRTLVGQPGHEYVMPLFSPDGRTLACAELVLEPPGGVIEVRLLAIDVETGASRELLAGSQLWPHEGAFSADGSALFFTADQQGRMPVFRVDLATGELTRLTSNGSYGSLAVARDGTALYALRQSVDQPPTPVRLDPGAADQEPTVLRSPAPPLELPGRLTETEATAPDGTTIRSWLVLPESASAANPAPLLLWIHGGPLSSWNVWSWRWNPWLMAARGYAVLLPDPALSTGYGQDMIKRGWRNWGEPTFTDLMAATDAACAREDVDGSRTAAMGGSFGGYMANWVAGHTERFDAIVTHASLWDLDSFYGTSDQSHYLEVELGHPFTDREAYEANSPHRYADAIRTPTLVVHGDKDFRVPIGQGMRLWYDLMARAVTAKFLYFPDENHWVLTPGNARVWYETVYAFLAEHVLGEKWERPELL